MTDRRMRRGLARLLLGGYLEPSERITLKTGVGTEIGPEHVEFSVQVGLVWRF